MRSGGPMVGKCIRRFNCYGFESDQYDSCKEQIAAENWKSARILNHILMVMMFVYAILSLSGVINRSFAPCYELCLVYTILVEVQFAMPHHRKTGNVRAARIDIGSACAGLMFFGIVASIVDPHQVATSFLVMQTLVALFLNYSLGYLMLFELGCMLIFDISSYLVKAPAIASGDVLNAFSFFLVCGFIAYFFHRERIHHYLISNHYHFMANIDSLTGLLNHQYFFAEADRILSGMPDAEYVFAVIDIDHFKEINDRFGHQVGDYCIRAVATNMLWSLLQSAPESCTDVVNDLFPAGKQAFIDNPGASYECDYKWTNKGFDKAKVATGRIGGDEFAILLSGRDPMARVRLAAEAIRTVRLPDGSGITCSIGCVQIRESESAGAIYKCADDALYAAKKNGRNQIFAVDGQISQSAEEHCDEKDQTRV